MSSLSPDAARRVYAAFCFMAWCDGEFADEERYVLQAFREDLGLSEAEAAPLEEKGAKPPSLELGEDGLELRYLVDGLIEVALADGKLAAEEESRLNLIAASISVPDLVERIKARVESRRAATTQRW